MDDIRNNIIKSLESKGVKVTKRYLDILDKNINNSITRFNNTIELEIDLIPVPAARPRSTSKFSGMYNPKFVEMNEHRETIKRLLKDNYNIDKIDNNKMIKATIEYYLPMPLKYSRSDVYRELCESKIILPDSSSDIDNYIKFTLDAMQPRIQKNKIPLKKDNSRFNLKDDNGKVIYKIEEERIEGIIENDSKVHTVTASKFYSIKPRTKIKIEF